ncbi:glycosyltransferase family 4 protein [Pseudoalteromonas sp. NBT06-2]|uniref:glycosyltransferase family 4 protein n=1 Tax=Pseudoalteromonas sp. NBT06-2 TaxID=2025950 RepID=UPI001482C99A|nr:glycosyltransferase family 4 protein [Pseudoalteromonas sp. NBT06-2]
MKRKNYIAVHLLNDFSGSPLVLANCIDALTSEGKNVELLTSGKNGFLSRCECKLTSFIYKRFENKLLTLLSFLFSQLLLLIMIFLKAIKMRNKPIVIINTILPFGAALGAKLAGCRIVYYVHETSIKPKILKRWLKFILRLTANDAIYVSNYLMQKEGVGKKGKINETVIYNSLPPEAIKLSAINNKKEFTVFMPSSLKRYKGVYDFVQLAKLLRNTDINFVMALNAEKSEFKEFLREVGELKNLTIYRRPKNINEIYSKSSLVLNLSNPNEWIETFGMTVIEAFNYGCPVIVPNIGGISEIVDQGYNGYKMSVVELNSISQKINQLSEDRDLYKELATNALTSSTHYHFLEYKNKIQGLL